jgi:hypothetical protein
MLQITLHLTRSSRLFQLLGFEVFLVRLEKESYYKDTQKSDFRPLEDKKKNIFKTESMKRLYLK